MGAEPEWNQCKRHAWRTAIGDTGDPACTRRRTTIGLIRMADAAPSPFSSADESFMRIALEAAAMAAAEEEVPVGAVLVNRAGEILAVGHNQPIGRRDPSAHAEMSVLREAAAKAGNYRMPGVTLYVTLEPCVMCAGALVIARIERLVFAARDLRFGAVRSKFELADSPILNHRVQVEEGLLAAEAAALLARFFESRR
jgi:tRNA(adenine34) deaminase